MKEFRKPAEIEHDIHETQAELESTVEALRQKLSPGELFGQTVDYLRESGSDVGRTFMGQVRDKPLPLALLAGSLAWLMISEGGARRESRREAYGGERFREIDEADVLTVTQYRDCFRALANVRPRIDETGDEFANRLYPAMAEALGIKQEPAERPERFRQRIEAAFDDLSHRAREAQHKISEQAQFQWRRTREGAREALGTAAHEVRRAGERAAYQARRAGERARHAGEEAASRARRLGDRAAVQARIAGDRAADTYHEYPLAVGALAVALGAFLGAALPSTRQERETLGRTGRDLREAAGTYAREAARAAGDVAGRMAGAARERAEREGLTPEQAEAAAADVGERLRRTGEEAIEAGREEAERKLRSTPPAGTRTGGR